MSSLFKPRTATPPSTSQITEDEFLHEVNEDYQPDDDDYVTTNTESPAQNTLQPTNPFAKKHFPGSPVVASATPTTEQVPSPAPAPAAEQPVPATAPAPVTRQTETERRRDPKLIQITLKIDRVLHGRVRYMTFKTGLSQSEILEELIRTHCPEVP